MELLTRIEEIILLTVYHLEDNAYGVSIREHIEQVTDKTFSVGAIYVPLERLSKRGYLTTTSGEPTAVRGGRRKRFYRVTPQGVSALLETKKLHDTMWAQLPDLKPSQIA